MSCIPHLAELGAIEREFRALTDRPKPLTVNGSEIGYGLSSQPVPLTDLREQLLDRGVPEEFKQAVWSLLVTRAQTGGPEWTVAATAMMAAGLRAAVFRVARPVPELRSDLESEIVTGFLEALLHTDPATPRLPGRLWWAAYAGGLKARRREYEARGYPLQDTDIGRRGPVPGHPDLVLAQAVTAKVLKPGDADLISSTRLQREPLRAAAKRHGLTYPAGKLRRWRAESRLLAYLGHHCLIGLHPDMPSHMPAIA